MFRLEPNCEILIIKRSARCKALHQSPRTKPHPRGEAENNEESFHPSVTRARAVSVNVLALAERIAVACRTSAQSATIKRLCACGVRQIISHIHQKEKDQAPQF